MVEYPLNVYIVDEKEGSLCGRIASDGSFAYDAYYAEAGVLP